MPATSLFCQPSARLAAAGWLVGLLALSGCHVHVDRPCCKFNWRVSVCGLTANCHECRAHHNCQPTLAPNPVETSSSDGPYSVGIQQVDSAAVATPPVAPTIRMPAFPTQQTASQSLDTRGASNIAAQVDEGSSTQNAGGDLQTLELNCDRSSLPPAEPAPAQLLVPQEEPVPQVKLPAKRTHSVRPRARDNGASNTVLVEVLATTAANLPTLAAPEQFASDSGSNFIDQTSGTTANRSARSSGMLRLTAIPKLSPNSFPPLVTLQPAAVDPNAEPPVPYQIVIAPLSKETNRRPLEPVLEAQRLGRVLEDGNTLRR